MGVNSMDAKHSESEKSSSDRSWRDRLPSAQDLHFDIDKYLNRIVPQNQAKKLPLPVARWLGYRPQPVQEVGNLLIAAWACLGAIIGLLVVGAVYKYSPAIAELDPPVIFASLGATAILDYNTIQSPLGQPRAAIVGHLVSVITGVGTAKLFMLSPNFDELRWIGGAVACGAASALMTLTNTVHPPGGATAVLAVVTPQIAALGWYFVGLILLGSVLMLGVALVLNNIMRQYPQFWWTPRDVRRPKKVAADEESQKPAIEHIETASISGESEATHVEVSADPHGLQRSKTSAAQLVVIGPHGLVLPEGFTLGPEEEGVVEILQRRLRQELQYEHNEGIQHAAHHDSVSDSDVKSSHGDSSSVSS